MKRLPVLVSFLLFSALCASITYWALQMLKPAARAVAAAPQIAKTDYSLDAATGLFGGRKMAAVAVASNYTLKGVVVSLNPQESIAILVTDGKPAQAVRVGAKVISGVTVQEVHKQYVLLSEGGVPKRVQLPDNALQQIGAGAPNGLPILSQPVPPNGVPGPGVSINGMPPPG
jgi:general secretion pathway protein C